MKNQKFNSDLRNGIDGIKGMGADLIMEVKLMPFRKF